MCDFLFGSLYGNVSEDEHRAVLNKYECKIQRGTKHDVKMAMKPADGMVDDKFRITEGMCDCGFLEDHDPCDSTIQEMKGMIIDLFNLPGAKQIYICIASISTGFYKKKKEVELKLKSTEIADFLANLQENTLYSIELADGDT